MIGREEILSYVKKNFNTEPDYPWVKHPNYAVLRHKSNRKMYGIIMTISKKKLGLTGEEDIEALNVKCEPELKDMLRSHPAVLPAYHMNKKHWVTIVLDGSFPKENIYNLIDLSYNLTK